MNLDALFQQIQFTEKQAREKRCLIQQAKLNISRSCEKINQIKEELSTAKMKLETEVSWCVCSKHNNEMHYIYKYMTHCFRSRFINALKKKASATKYHSTKKTGTRKMTEEEDNFTKEVTEFNNEYGLTSNRELLIKKKIKTELNDLENEIALLK
ncbi:CC172 protein, partial [Alcedo cyanopectus]|nr:CC172 protein [Ceyx cyanopectus]